MTFARSGAAGASGTAEAFLKDNGYKNVTLKDKTKKVLSGDDKYGRNTIETSESNSEAMQFFIANTTSRPSMIYLSLGYVLNNENILKENGLNILSYEPENSKEAFEPNLDNVNKNLYNWVRPFNVMLSVESQPLMKKFVEYIVFKNLLDKKDKEALDSIFKEYGLIELNDEQIKSMFLNLKDDLKNRDIRSLYKEHLDKFWVSDFSQNNPSHFGAKI